MVVGSMTPFKGFVQALFYTLAAVISVISLFFLITLFFVGIPDTTKPVVDYAQRLCLLVKGTIDPHLPCIEHHDSQLHKPGDREALWSVVNTLCLPASYLGFSFPCLKIDRTEGYAIIKSPVKDRLDFIFTPTKKIAGIENLVSGLTDDPNLWRIAWRERGLLQQATGHPLNWDAVALAVNSKSTRSQDQLHIHLGCIDPALRVFLGAQKFTSMQQWLLLRPDGVNSGVFVKLLPKESIDRNLFSLIFDEIPGGKAFAEKETIAVAGVTQGAWRGFALMVTLEPTPAESFLATDC